MKVAKLGRILLVEDDDDIRKIAEICLAKIGGYEVFACDNGFDAIAQFKSNKFDLVILDVMMPKIDGPDTLKELKGLENFGQTKVVFMTAKSQKHEIESFLQLGAVAVISKPFDPTSLAGQIDQIWEEQDVA